MYATERYFSFVNPSPTISQELRTIVLDIISNVNQSKFLLMPYQTGPETENKHLDHRLGKKVRFARLIHSPQSLHDLERNHTPTKESVLQRATGELAVV